MCVLGSSGLWRQRSSPLQILPSLRRDLNQVSGNHHKAVILQRGEYGDSFVRIDDVLLQIRIQKTDANGLLKRPEPVQNDLG